MLLFPTLPLTHHPSLPPSLPRLLRKDEYVRVVSGRLQGKYGIFNGVRSGEVEVILRSEGAKDEFVTVAAAARRYLADPPEKKWTTMTAR